MEIDCIDYIFGINKNLNATSKQRPVQKPGSYMLALAKGNIISHVYEPIPKSVYLEGAKYISSLLCVSAVALIFEYITGKRLS